MAWSFWKQSHFAMETSYIALVYGDSLRDNFEGFTPLNQSKFDALETKFVEESGKPRPNLAEMLRVEIALVNFLPDEVIVSRYWSIYDRFRRVVPGPSCDRYDASIPGRGDGAWQNPAFVRVQSATLLNTIHANYLTNIGREKSVQRLKFIIGLCAMLVMLLYWLFNRFTDDKFVHSLITLSAAGTFGAFLSLLNRMQNAVAADATAQDGIYELTGLRVGWVGIVISFILGGGFSLVMYCIVMAGALNIAAPLPQAIADARESKPVTMSTDSPTGASTSKAAEANKDPADQSQPGPKAKEKESNSPEFAVNEATALGLSGTTEFFKMLLLAFIAGFAERFVPDILNRLTKQNSGT